MALLALCNFSYNCVRFVATRNRQNVARRPPTYSQIGPNVHSVNYKRPFRVIKQINDICMIFSSPRRSFQALGQIKTRTNKNTHEYEHVRTRTRTNKNTYKEDHVRIRTRTCTMRARSSYVIMTESGSFSVTQRALLCIFN